MAKIILCGYLAAAVFAAVAELRAANAAIKMVGALGGAASGAHCQAAFIDFIDYKTYNIGE